MRQLYRKLLSRLLAIKAVLAVAVVLMAVQDKLFQLVVQE
jgi:hypothetical protein